MASKSNDSTQQSVDSFYRYHGKCCAGCDWWRHYNSLIGECTKSAPVAGDQRDGMIGIEICKVHPLKAGHILTRRDHLCGDFVDTFDWSGANA